MDDYKKMILGPEPGDIIPVVREIEIDCPVEYFAKLSDYGRKENSCFFESRDYLMEDNVGALSFGTANPALYISGKGQGFTIKALSDTGRRKLKFLPKSEKSS